MRRDATRKRQVLLMMGLAVLLAFVAQYYFVKKSALMWDGIAVYAIAMFLFYRTIAKFEAEPDHRKARGPGIWHELWAELRRSVPRGLLLGLGLASALFVAAAAGARSQSRPFWDLLVLWFVGVSMTVAAFMDWNTVPRRLLRSLQELLPPSPELALIGVLAVATLLLRSIRISSIPFVLSGDEATMGLEAVSVIDGRRTNPFETGWLSHPTMYFFVQALFVRLFGATPTGLRLSSALISGVTTVLLYVFARRLFGRWVATIACILVAASHFAVHFGRIGLNNVWDPFFALGVLYCVTRGLEEKSLGYLLAAGCLLGLSLYFYMGARVIPVIVLAYLVHWEMGCRGTLRENRARMVVSGLGALVVALPLLAHFRAHPDMMVFRYRQLGIFPSGWIYREMERTGATMLGVLANQFLRSVLALNHTVDPTFFYRPGVPLLGFLSSVFFVFGLAYAISHSRRREFFLLLAWFLLVNIFGGVLMENPPYPPRLVIAIPAVFLLVALGMIKVASFGQLALGQPRRVAVALSLILALCAAYQSLHFYFVKYTPASEYAGLNTEMADGLGKYLGTLGSDYRCYLGGAPRIYYRDPTIQFLAPSVSGVDVPVPIPSGLEFVDPVRKAIFAFTPERRQEIEVVRRLYPTGLLREFRSKKGDLLFVSYEVSGND